MILLFKYIAAWSTGKALKILFFPVLYQGIHESCKNTCMHLHVIHVVCKHYVGMAYHTPSMCFLGHFDFGVEFRPYQLDNKLLIRCMILLIM